jgi:PAS domain-containing protein
MASSDQNSPVSNTETSLEESNPTDTLPRKPIHPLWLELQFGGFEQTHQCFFIQSWLETMVDQGFLPNTSSDEGMSAMEQNYRSNVQLFAQILPHVVTKIRGNKLHLPQSDDCYNLALTLRLSLGNNNNNNNNNNNVKRGYVDYAQYLKIREGLVVSLLQYLQTTCPDLQIQPSLSPIDNLVNNLPLCLLNYRPDTEKGSTMPLCEDLNVLWALGLLIWDLQTELTILDRPHGRITWALLLLSHFMSRGTFRWAHFMMMAFDDMDLSQTHVDLLKTLMFHHHWFHYLVNEIQSQDNILAIYWFARCTLRLGVNPVAVAMLEGLLFNQDLVICADDLTKYQHDPFRGTTSFDLEHAAKCGDAVAFLKLSFYNIVCQKVPSDQVDSWRSFFDQNKHLDIYKMVDHARIFYRNYGSSP